MNILLVQLPIPKLNYGLKTGNIPLGAACLKQASSGLDQFNIDILPESVSSYIGDAALICLICNKKPDMVGFTVFAWNLERTLFIAEQLKKQLNIKIVVGGPEITPDNILAASPFIDHYVYGEGEQAFVNLLTAKDDMAPKKLSVCAESVFQQSKSPYLDNLLEPDIENLMLLETQRGCPYKCGFCFYNKSRSTIAYKDTEHILTGVRWAVDNNIDELYILDPSLNTRPELKSLLTEIAEINRGRPLSINSEIRAESIDAELADLFLSAGFTGFEIGLQTTNKEALKIMRRPTNLKRFLTGATLLKEREILPRIDLITGLPGDDLQGFSGSIGFVYENNLYDDVQVFPLSILPGTDFRANCEKLNIKFEKTPPYTVIETDRFSKEDMLLAFDYAESLFDVTLFPFPNLDIGWKKMANTSKNKDILISLGSKKLISKVIIDSYRTPDDLKAVSKQLTFPYQVYINSEVKDEKYIVNLLNILTIENPFTPFEIIFITPEKSPDTSLLLEAARLKRPGFLDNDLRYLYAGEGNRSILFTVISDSIDRSFAGEMKRQVYRWEKPFLPEETDLDKLSQFDGILIDNDAPFESIEKWQLLFSESFHEFVPVSFSDLTRQKKWRNLTLGDDYYEFE